ncbi:nuclear transport factor 2 family protein [Streptomyces sp. NPDC002308]
MADSAVTTGTAVKTETAGTADTVQQYLATWNASGEERAKLLSEHWLPEVTYTDPLAEVSGHEGVAAVIDGVREQFPGLVFTQVGEVDAHHRQLRFRWGLGLPGAEPLVIGFDVLVLDESGQIQDVRGFLDKVPA